MRLPVLTIILLAAAWMWSTGCTSNVERWGLSYRGETFTDGAQLLVDETWIDDEGLRHVDQEIFDAVFSIIDEAEEFILMDFFLVNDFLYEPGPGMRPLSRELTDRLLAKHAAQPDLPMIFITDPLNTMYGSLMTGCFAELQDAGVDVVWTDLDRLRDSNPLYSKPWRLLVKPWGVGPGNTLPNPLGEGRISMRSMLKLLNFKANHRKLIVTDKSLLVTSANPHSASSAHWNIAMRIDDGGIVLGRNAESAILEMSGAATLAAQMRQAIEIPVNASGRQRLLLLTEGRIKEEALHMLAQAPAGARIDLSMFYLSERDLIEALLDAKQRGCDIRVILDPNKDAFGRIKDGVPNRQTAARLVKAGIPLRWADTHGEQFHVKMLYAEQPGRSATLLLGSCNFTRRNMDNLNAECDAAITASLDDAALVRARTTFDRWWSNPEGRRYTVDYAVYEDSSRWRRFKAWLKETTGMSSF